jgi:hypothetical protein
MTFHPILSKFPNFLTCLLYTFLLIALTSTQYRRLSILDTSSSPANLGEITTCSLFNPIHLTPARDDVNSNPWLGLHFGVTATWEASCVNFLHIGDPEVIITISCPVTWTWIGWSKDGHNPINSTCCPRLLLLYNVHILQCSRCLLRITRTL